MKKNLKIKKEHIFEQYFLGKDLKNEFIKINLNNSFNSLYEIFINIFSNRKLLKYKKNNQIKAIGSSKLKNLLIVKGKKKETYCGSLWQNKDILYIGSLGFLYTFPLWDWWINNLFLDKKYRSKDKSIIITKRKKSLKNIKEILIKENYLIVDSVQLGKTKKSSIFEEMLLEIYPRKIAYQTNQIIEKIKKDNFEKIIFILRGGFFIYSLFPEKIKKKSSFYNKDDKFSITKEKTLIIDDCISSGKTLKKIIKNKNKNVYFASIDSTLPSFLYEQTFQKINLLLPKNNLNIYSCRFFEENPFMIGNNYNFEAPFNPIRMYWIKRIKLYMSESNRKLLLEINERLNKIKNFE